jgi:putative sporulation protein YtaF
MKVIVHLLLLSIAANLDNLGVGVAYGVKKIKVPPLSNLIIAGIAFLFGCISVLIGTGIRHFLNNNIANVIGAFLIIGVGIWMILPKKLQLSLERDLNRHETSLIIKILHEPEQADCDHSAIISWRESILLGVALSINVFTNGISAGLWKLNVIYTALSMAAFSYITIELGTRLGSRYGSRWLGNKASLAAAILLILIGIHQIL